MLPHTIRLQAVWEPPVVAAGASLAGAVGAWLRRFGRPGGLEEGLRLLLVVETRSADRAGPSSQPPLPEALALNGMPLPRPAPGATEWVSDITCLVRERNELLLTPAVGHPMADARRGISNPHGRCDLPEEFGCVSLRVAAQAPEVSSAPHHP